MSTFMAFLHHAGAFGLVAALSAELVLLGGELTARSARRLRVADLMVGLSAMTVLAAGLLRVFYFEKGSAYYFHSAAFHAKLGLFIALALLSIYPTLVFASWGKAMRRGEAPGFESGSVRKVRMIVHTELAGIVLMLLFAAMMARGVGFLR